MDTASSVRRRLINFLLEVCPPILQCPRKDLQAVLTRKDLGGDNVVKRFVTDNACRVLVVGSELISSTGEAGSGAPKSAPTNNNDKEETSSEVGDSPETEDSNEMRLYVSLEIDRRATTSAAIAFLKRPNVTFVPHAEGMPEGDSAVDGAEHVTAEAASESLGLQLQIMNVGYSDNDTTSFEVVSNYLRNSFEAMLTCQAGSTAEGAAADEEETGNLAGSRGQNVTVVRKKLAELVVSVKQAQQNVEIPLIQLPIDPSIKAACEAARAAGRKVAPDVDFADKLADNAFLNQLQSGVNKWNKEIQKVTKMNRDVTQGSAVEEVNFWLGMERALLHIEQQLQQAEPEATLAVLRSAKRFLATISFQSDTDFKKRLDEVANINQLMRDFPLNDLLAANSTEQITTAIRSVFIHLKRLKSASQYPIKSACHLVEAISRDVNSQLHKVLSGQRLMHLTYEEFDFATVGCRQLFAVWDEEVRKFKELLREKKLRLQPLMPPKINCEHTALQLRIDDLRKLRRQHQRLLDVVSRVLGGPTGGGNVSAHREITYAYKLFLSVDVLDTSRAGQDTWENAKKAYNDKIDRAESQITNRLRDRLGAAKTAPAMFRVFGQFNALFFRPRVRGAIQEYQTSLIKQVKDDLKSLQAKYRENYPRTNASRSSNVRDIPPAAGEIVWAKQIERRLQMSLRRVEDVLGKGWEQHVDGQELKHDGEAFQRKLNPMGIYEQWLKCIKDGQKLDGAARIFAIRPLGGRGFELVVNCDDKLISLFKEVRYFYALSSRVQLRVPYSIKVMSDEAKFVYPTVTRLQECVRAYTQTCLKLEEPGAKDVAPLLGSYISDVHKVLREGFSLKWEFDRLDQFGAKLSELVYLFEAKVEEVESKSILLQHHIDSLRTLPLTSNCANFADHLNNVQAIIEELALCNFSNLEGFVEHLDKQVEKIIEVRLSELVKLWIQEFTHWPDNGTEFVRTGREHCFKIQRQMLYLSPSVEAARQKWVGEFHKTLGSLCRLKRLHSGISSESQRGTHDVQASGAGSYRHLMASVSTETLQSAYKAIGDTIGKLEEYVDTWLQYQCLWDIEVPTIMAKLGDDLEAWHQLFNEIRASGGTFDVAEDRRTFGPIVVDCSMVQTKVHTKCAAWHREIANAFGFKIGGEITRFFNNVVGARDELESQADPSRLTFLQIDPSKLGELDSKGEITAAVTQFVLRLQLAKEQESSWAPGFEYLKQSERLLVRQRFTFPSEWLCMERVSGEWETFQQLLRHQATLFERHRQNVQRTVLQYDRIVKENLGAVYSDWAKNRPVHGDTPPEQALQTLSRVEQKLNKVREDYDKVNKAKQALEMDCGELGGLGDSGLSPEALQEEMTSLKGVWTELEELYRGLSALKETPWSAVVPRKVRGQLEELLQNIKKIPAKFRQYEAFEHVQASLHNYLKMNMVISEMRSDALKERHWKRILEVMRLRCNFSDLTLAHLWDNDIPRHEQQIREILVQAQGEMALEHFLQQVRDAWTEMEFDLVVYKSKSKLIRGWDDLFTLMDEHLNALQSMRVSPYFKIFEEDCVSWEEKLNRLRVLLDAWREVQRKWVYLEGVFTGSNDIQALLPNEFSRFKSIDNDFLSIMKKAVQRPKVLDIAGTEGLQRSLDRLSDLLSKIQKALGEYLQRQRHVFPRFYFVGDEDLLEMIGNSKDVLIVQRHLNKMFAGIAFLLTSESDPDVITSMSSKEGETVPLREPIVISKHPSLNAWLQSVEKQMAETLIHLLSESLKHLGTFEALEFDKSFVEWIAKYPAQVGMLAVQIDWTSRVSTALQEAATAVSKGVEKQQAVESLRKVAKQCEGLLKVLAASVLVEENPLTRCKFVRLITEIVHQRDVVRNLASSEVTSSKDFKWLQYLRFYHKSKADGLASVEIEIADAKFSYGWEYLGISENIVQTPLTDRCYLTLTQALHMRLGGNPFGPAGTGKTETVKALGSQLGRFVLVFCCDETFDLAAMNRIFVGLCQVGAWGCFDEFNRLEERILSACSEQILNIQMGLRSMKNEIDLLNYTVKLNPAMGIFVTMNPGYAGRSNLPDNLKQLFREVAMIVPDKVQITQVLLYSQGFKSAERLSGKIVSLFDLCVQQLSRQAHYDFGLRALKSVLTSAGNLKRMNLSEIRTDSDLVEMEQLILIRSVSDTIVPKLVADDAPLLRSLVQGVFPGCEPGHHAEEAIDEAIRRTAQVHNLECRPSWLNKVYQLHQIQKLHHGVMMVGPVGTGKSQAWKILLEALERVDGMKGLSYVIDPKAVGKEELFGKLDSTTLEWTDGVFTALLRKILSQQSSNAATSRRHWIVFDGDVDPEWAENLNSVLDDNKLLTLPNGERLQIPTNVRIMFEVDALKAATPATVSRCGMVWFSDEVLEVESVISCFLATLRHGAGDIEQHVIPEKMLSSVGGVMSTTGAPVPHQYQEPPGSYAFHEGESDDEDKRGGVDSFASGFGGLNFGRQFNENEINVRRACSEYLMPLFEADGFIHKCLETAGTYEHVFPFTKIRVLEGLFSLLRKGISMIVEYNEMRPDFLMTAEHMENFITKWVALSVCWGFGGSLPLSARLEFSADVATFCTSIQLPPGLDQEVTILDYEPRIDDGEWHHWRERVSAVELEPHQVQDATLIIETVDTIRHRYVLGAWLEEKKPFVLCGPPGSGKTMTLLSTLKGLADFDIASLNFSSGTTPELLLKTFDHYCEYVKTTNGVVLRPTQPGKWLIVFCDEINLPLPDKYGTQRVIMFVRQITERGGFWRPLDQYGTWVWVKLERIQFAGACNPPTDAGRHPLSDRFLRHAPVIFVDFPGAESLKQIYGTFNRAMLRPIPSLRSYAANLTNSMVDFYRASQQNFTVDMQPHYIYSPRELTRWKVALHEALDGRTHVELKELVRLYIHEGLRIFQDRLVDRTDRDWTDATINNIAKQQFPGLSHRDFKRPILYSCFLSRNYEEVARDDLRTLVSRKLRVFNEEELNVQLVLFDEVLDHITRIDRVLRQPLGHLLIVGVSGAGKTVLSKFVSWLNGLKVFQIKAGRNYDTLAFEADLRSVMRRAGLRDEKITFIFDESNALGPAFLERMNALLASGEVPGLFEGDEYTSLISECKSAFGTSAVPDDSDLFARFTIQVQKNLHIVFTMNPANPDFSNRQATSPALFNRCVIDWFGDWPHSALLQVAAEFTENLEITSESFEDEDGVFADDEQRRREAVAQAIVFMHETVAALNTRLLRNGKRYNYVTPRDFLDLIRHFVALVGEKKDETVENTKHLNSGLHKLRETETQVAELQASLAVKENDLSAKNKMAEEKMELMVLQQADAEQSKKKAEVLSQKLEEDKAVIEQRTQAVNTELDEVEPLLREAQNSVSNIAKKNLDELRAFANPPSMVKFAVEAVVVMLNNLGEKPLSWEECRRTLKGGDFINRVLTFDSSDISAVTVNRVRCKYIETKEWDVDRINKASKASGPLAKWVESSIAYQMIIQKVAPLRQEIDSLSAAQTRNQKKFDETQALISRLEGKLQEYKDEYAQLISEVQVIKKDMQTVLAKVERSTQLLSNLASENDRWRNASEAIREQRYTDIGDCLLAAGLCTYIGFFEHSDRHRLLGDWKNVLVDTHIRFRGGISFSDFLSKPSERLSWCANALPSDNLSIENAIILKRYIRYPLMIDPSGQATNFIVNAYAVRKLVKTSFVDTAFMKHLESSLRFGTPLLVQDVEKVDPILNSVLNQETHKAGGRVLINVGDSEIDFSPAFTMFLATRDPTAQYTPDLCSRVTFVNFTLTPSSLQNQCLNLVLKSERPDVDKRRTDMLKLQGEFKVKVRELEDSLLLALSNVHTNVLDDEKVINTLETLKSQAAKVAIEAARTDEVMEEVQKTSDEYLPLAQAAARLFFTLQHLDAIHHLYHYDLIFFETLFHDVLKDKERLAKAKDYQARLELLFDGLFQNVFRRVAVGMLNDDQLSFALQMARIKIEVKQDAQIGGEELDLLLQGELITANVGRGAKNPIAKKQLANRLGPEQVKLLNQLSALEPFYDLVPHINAHPDQWVSFLNHAKPENVIPAECVKSVPKPPIVLEEPSSDPELEEKLTLTIRHCLLIKTFRPDRLPVLLWQLIRFVFGENTAFDDTGADEQEFMQTVTKFIPASMPVVMVSAPGFDPSSRVVNHARDLGYHLASIAMGSEEGYPAAEKAIVSAARSGTWVLLKNVHLSCGWLHDLEKKLFRTQVHDRFRLFLTMEFNHKVPQNLLRVSYKCVLEPAVGLRASMLRTYSKYTTASAGERKPVVARLRLHFLMAFLHAVVLERKRYIPFGWCKGYEFGDADQVCALAIVDRWLDQAAAVSSSGNSEEANPLLEQIDPQKIPWGAIRALLQHVVYGGRLDNEIDQAILSSFIVKLFCPEAFESDFYLSNSGVDGIAPLKSPDLFRTRGDYLAWIEALPHVDEPTWLGFAPNSERLLSARLGRESLQKWSALQSQSAEDLRDLLPQASVAVVSKIVESVPEMEGEFCESGDEAGPTRQMSQGGGGWVHELLPTVENMLGAIPPGLELLPRSPDAVKDPLWRCFDRETATAARLTTQIRSELGLLKEICLGHMKFTNYLRELAGNTSSGTVPSTWAAAYSSIEGASMASWLTDFSRRVRQLAIIGQAYGGGMLPGECAASATAHTAQVTSILGSTKLGTRSVWLGGLLFPTAYLTASQQCVAQQLTWSLDDLRLEVIIGPCSGLVPNDLQAFQAGGISLEGAAWDSRNHCLQLTETLQVALPQVSLRWRKGNQPRLQNPSAKTQEVPLFLDKTRKELLTTVHIPIPDNVPPAVWTQRGVALIIWSSL